MHFGIKLITSKCLGLLCQGGTWTVETGTNKVLTTTVLSISSDHLQSLYCHQATGAGSLDLGV